MNNTKTFFLMFGAAFLASATVGGIAYYVAQKKIAALEADARNTVASAGSAIGSTIWHSIF